MMIAIVPVLTSVYFNEMKHKEEGLWVMQRTWMWFAYNFGLIMASMIFSMMSILFLRVT